MILTVLGTLASSSVKKTTLCLGSDDSGCDSVVGFVSGDSAGLGDISELI